MSKLMNLKLDVSKISRDKIFVGKKGKYIDITISLNETPDQHGNHLSAWESQSKEERQAKSPKVYLGNGKVFWSGQESNPQSQEEERDDLPF